jgi:hypothetical protein
VFGLVRPEGVGTDPLYLATKNMRGRRRCSSKSRQQGREDDDILTTMQVQLMTAQNVKDQDPRQLLLFT